MPKSTSKLLEAIKKNVNVQIGSWKIGDFVTYKAGKNATALDGVIVGVKNFKEIVKIQVWLVNGRVLNFQSTKNKKFERKTESGKYTIYVLDEQKKTFELELVVQPDPLDVVQPDPLVVQPDPLDSLVVQPDPLDPLVVQPDPLDPLVVQPDPLNPLVVQPDPLVVQPDPLVVQPAPLDDEYASFIEAVDKIKLKDYSVEYGMINKFFESKKDVEE
jgi:hypothetical protein